jgi:hypothetical protein
MSTNLEIETLSELVAYRQAYLRSLARPGHGQPALPRRMTGRLLIRFGRWVEGHRPDETRPAVPPLPATTPRLAGGHH